MNINHLNESSILNFFLILMMILVILTIGYMPLIGYGLCLILLSLGVGSNNFFSRIFLTIGVIFSSSVIVGSRTFNIGASNDDFSNYYFPRYIDISYGSTIFDPAFAGGLEFLLPLLFKMISSLSGGSQSAPLLLFLNVFISQTILYCWLEKFGLKNISQDKKSLCIAFTFIFFSILMPVQFFRQVYSSLFVLFSLSYFFDKKIIKTILYLVLAALFHTSALFIFFIFYLMMSESKRNHIIIISLSIVISIFLIPVMYFISKYNLLGAATYKINFYLLGGTENLFGNFGKLKFVILMLVLKYFYFIKDEGFSKYNNLINIAGISYCFLVFIPVLPERIFNIYIAIIFGYLLFLSTYRVEYLIRIILCFFIIYKIYNYCFDYHYLNMLNFSYSGLWYSYTWFGDTMFYYFNSF